MVKKVGSNPPSKATSGCGAVLKMFFFSLESVALVFIKLWKERWEAPKSGRLCVTNFSDIK